MANNNNGRTHHMGTPGVPMIYQPQKLDTHFSDELAARLCREYTEECVDSLVEHMRDRSNPQTSLVATNNILDRAYGKAKEIKTDQNPNGKKNYKIQIEFIDVIDQPAKREAQPLHSEPQFVDPK
jgi:hypothetical protein